MCSSEYVSTTYAVEIFKGTYIYFWKASSSFLLIVKLNHCFILNFIPRRNPQIVYLLKISV